MLTVTGEITPVSRVKTLTGRGPPCGDLRLHSTKTSQSNFILVVYSLNRVFGVLDGRMCFFCFFVSTLNTYNYSLTISHSFFPYDMFRKKKPYQHVFSLMYSHLKDALKYNQPTHLSWSFYCSGPRCFRLTWVSSLCHLAWRVKLINSSADGCIQRS